MEEIVARSICRIGRSGETCSSKRSLSDLPVFSSGEKGSPVFHLYDPLNSLPAQDLYSILISQIIAPLDRVKGMVFPSILNKARCISQGGIDPTLSSHGVRSKWMNLRENGHL